MANISFMSPPGFVSDSSWELPRSRENIRPKKNRKNRRPKAKKKLGPKAKKELGPHGPQFFFRLLPPILFSAFAPHSFLSIWPNVYFLKAYCQGRPRYILEAALYHQHVCLEIMSLHRGPNIRKGTLPHPLSPTCVMHHQCPWGPNVPYAVV